jgi:hypothetical protein
MNRETDSDEMFPEYDFSKGVRGRYAGRFFPVGPWSVGEQVVLDQDVSNGKRAVARTEEVSPDLLVDYATDGSPLGLEILSPATVTIERVWAVFDQLGLDRPPASELSPLPAA